MIKKEVTIGNCRLILGDCLEVMPLLDGVDAIITDPPYTLDDSSPSLGNTIGNLDKFLSADYKKLTNGFDLQAVFGNLERICTPYNMFCFCSNKQISDIMTYHQERHRSTNLLVWHKTNAVPFANGVWRGDIEFIVHTKDKGAVFQGNAVEKKKVSEYPIVVDKEHPTVKPLMLIEKYVKICSNIGDTVIDPFMGSGTTGVACAKMGRKFIGIELDERYFDVACERIDNAYRQGVLI